MRVLLNALVAVGAKTGIGHYTDELLRCLPPLAGPGAVEAFPAGWLRWAAGAARRLLRRRPQTPSARAEGAAHPGWRAWAVQALRERGRALLGRRFRAACRRGGFTLYHEPNFIPLESDLPVVATVHDLSVLLHPQWHPADRVKHFERHFRRGLAGCAHFLAISEFGRREIIRTLGLAPERVTRTYMGIRPGLGPLPAKRVQQRLRRLGLPPRYLLYVGTLEPRKNLLTLLRAYCGLPAPLRERYPLLLAGGWGWGAESVAAFLEAEGRQRGVRHLGYAAEADLPALYNGARALAFPSLYEGFGLPPLEMLACGGAVLASTAGAVAETAGAAAHLIDPADEGGWRNALHRVLSDDDWWRQLRRGAVAAARPFTWQRCAADTLAVYRALDAERRPVGRAA
jgi:alpha-1,3-rhamnosyl/mannosyltransferase